MNEARIFDKIEEERKKKGNLWLEKNPKNSNEKLKGNKKKKEKKKETREEK